MMIGSYSGAGGPRSHESGTRVRTGRVSEGSLDCGDLRTEVDGSRVGWREEGGKEGGKVERRYMFPSICARSCRDRVCMVEEDARDTA